MDFNDKIRGMLAGFALGDALGAPHEKRWCREEYTGKIEFETINISRWEGKKVYPPGIVTDDTLMMLMLYDVCENLENGNIPPSSFSEEAVLNYEIFAKDCPFLGKNTRDLFKNVKTYKGYLTRFNKKFTSDEIRESVQPNGAMMRSPPIAMIRDESLFFEILKKDCYLTNPNEMSLVCEMIYLSILRGILFGSSLTLFSLEEVEMMMEDNDLNSKDKEILKNTLYSTERDLSVSKGWCVTALWCVLQEYKKLLSLIEKGSEINFTDELKFLMVNWTDTDTNGAIVGAMIGAIIGYEKLVKDEVNKNNLKIIERVTTLSFSEYSSSKK